MKLNQPVNTIKGIGDELENDLNSLGIHTIKDMLEYFPYRYEDNELSNLEDVKHGDSVTLEGQVQNTPNVRYYGGKKSKLTARILVGRILINAVIFNRAFLKKSLTPGKTVTISGKWDQHRMTVTVDNIELSSFSNDRAIKPIYSLKEGIYQKQFRRFIESALLIGIDDMEELLPGFIQKKYKLYSKREAIQAIHFPKNHTQLKQARRRIVYEELLLFQLKMQALRKFERENSKGTAKQFSHEELKKMVGLLPFELTVSQHNVLKEILTDLRSPYRMNRLLQGDVGSGKTVIAAITLYAAVLAGYQGALMVPTEILAEQHMESLQQLLASHNISIALLTSSVKGKRREDILSRLKAGDIQIIVGTHSLIQEDVNFHHLGLVITDEQHRFGVNQRRALKSKGLSPDVLFMTATPIPRTLAITAFGDMDISAITELPAGRKPIETYWVKDSMLERVYGFLNKEIAAGRQAYVICPLIEESDKLDVQNVIDVHEEIVHHFPDFKVGLMHGRLTNEEKETVMRQFSENNIQILVSTTVVEVGVNVPNASLMIIYDAERFGLAQLHQLRGRVGRGSSQSYCILIANPKSEEGKERMRVMTETNDGFLLSEKDLKIRGPGDFFGQKQSGIPQFKVADLVHDYRALEVARDDAKQFIESESFWTEPAFEKLRHYLSNEEFIKGEKLD
ncbi:DNA helicase RecG [Pueribacillus theae]|uniref:ATP-dependent DNA helicase RecG n=1 Tax=Pueribacillus theae TaxID=2171751 RepID=A0A2U1K8I2_9BACI|nr:ATP-dependent DNA helicase RecG [Pueribacillus theae]PWA13468.1 DNA helicase RecG [Pueribacillus theae]